MKDSNQPGPFGSAARTEILYAIYLLGQTYPRELARLLDRNLSATQKTIASLEVAGLISTYPDGAARRVTINERYIAKKELQALLQALTIHEVALQEKLGKERRRPRRTGKEIS